MQLRKYRTLKWWHEPWRTILVHWECMKWQLLLKYFLSHFYWHLRAQFVHLSENHHYMSKILPKHEIYGHTHILSMLSKLLLALKCLWSYVWHLMLNKIKELTTWNKHNVRKYNIATTCSDVKMVKTMNWIHILCKNYVLLCKHATCL